MASMDSSKIRGNSQGLLRSPVSPPASPSLPPVSPEGKARVDTLIEKLNSLELPEDLSLSQKQIDYLNESFKTACIDGETLKYAVERLRHLCLSNQSAIAKVAATFNVVWEFEAESVKLRSVLLSCLQADFENRHEMQANTPEKFLNAVALLGEVFARVRIAKYPISALSVPVLEYLEALLTGDETEIELFVRLIILISDTLREDLKGTADGEHPSLNLCSPLQNLLVKVRSTLMSRNLSCQSRLWLLFVMDLTSSGEFKAPSPSLQVFYKNKDHLGSSADLLLKSIHLSETTRTPVENPSSSRLGHSSPQKDETVVTDRVAHINISPKGNDKESIERTGNISRKKASPEKTGYADKRENFRSAFKVDSNKGKAGKSYWLHDDRCETDEKSSGFKEKTTGSFSKPRGSEGGNWRRLPDARGETDSSWRQSQTKKVGKEEREHSRTAPPSSTTSTSDDLLAGHTGEESWD